MPEDEREPIQRAARGTEYDLYDIADWEERSTLDRLATSLHSGLIRSGRVVVVLLAILIVVAQFALTGIAAINQPTIAIYILLSVVPALGLATYVWKVDVTMREPLGIMVVTFLLGFLFAGFAAVFNTILQGFFQYIPLVGMVLFFYLVVAPIEETVKWLAVRLYAYRSDEFDAVIDGAVYGAVAGLGFATIENSIYITQNYLNAAGTSGGAALGQAFQTAAVRSLAGPGHVIYSAFAGYYLGLAKFNPGRRGPIIVKGLLIAALIHGTYNSLVSNLGLVTLIPGFSKIGMGVIFVGFVFVYDGVFMYLLYRKLSRYRETFVATNAADYYDDETAGEDAATSEGAEPTETTSTDESERKNESGNESTNEGGFVFESQEPSGGREERESADQADGGEVNRGRADENEGQSGENEGQSGENEGQSDENERQSEE